MTLDEKRKKIAEHCALQVSKDEFCDSCPLLDVVKKEKGNCYSAGANIERNYDILFGKEENQNPYWERICKLADKQRAKGIETYGQGIECNPAAIVERIDHLEEELIDALYYLEWIKGGLNETK